MGQPNQAQGANEPMPAYMKMITQIPKNTWATVTMKSLHSAGTVTNTIAHAAAHSKNGTMRGSSYRCGISTRSIHAHDRARTAEDNTTGRYPQIVTGRGSFTRAGSTALFGNAAGIKRNWSEVAPA